MTGPQSSGDGGDGDGRLMRRLRLAVIALASLVTLGGFLLAITRMLER